MQQASSSTAVFAHSKHHEGRNVMYRANLSSLSLSRTLTIAMQRLSDFHSVNLLDPESLQAAVNAAARLVSGVGKYDHITPVLLEHSQN